MSETPHTALLKGSPEARRREVSQDNANASNGHPLPNASNSSEPEVDIDVIAAHFPNTSRLLEERSPSHTRISASRSNNAHALTGINDTEKGGSNTQDNININSSSSSNKVHDHESGGAFVAHQQQYHHRHRNQDALSGGDEDGSGDEHDNADVEDEDDAEVVRTLTGEDIVPPEAAKRFTKLHKRRAELSKTVQDRLDKASARREQLQAERIEHLKQTERRRQAKTQQTRMLRRIATERFVREAPKALGTLRSAGLICDEGSGYRPLSPDAVEIILMSDPRTCSDECCRTDPNKLRLPVCPATGQPHRRLLIVAAETFLKLIGDTRVNLIPSRIEITTAAKPTAKKSPSSTAAALPPAGGSTVSSAAPQPSSAAADGPSSAPSSAKAKRGIAVNPQLFVLAYYNAVLPDGEIDPLLRDCAISLCHITEQVRKMLVHIHNKANTAGVALAHPLSHPENDPSGSQVILTDEDELSLKPLLISFSREWQRYARLSNQHILSDISREEREKASRELVKSTEETLKHTYRQLAAAVAEATAVGSETALEGATNTANLRLRQQYAAHDVQALSSFIAMLRSRLVRVSGGHAALEAFDEEMKRREQRAGDTTNTSHGHAPEAKREHDRGSEKGTEDDHQLGKKHRDGFEENPASSSAVLSSSSELQQQQQRRKSNDVHGGRSDNDDNDNDNARKTMDFTSGADDGNPSDGYATATSTAATVAGTTATVAGSRARRSNKRDGGVGLDGRKSISRQSTSASITILHRDPSEYMDTNNNAAEADNADTSLGQPEPTEGQQQESSAKKAHQATPAKEVGGGGGGHSSAFEYLGTSGSDTDLGGAFPRRAPLAGGRRGQAPVVYGPALPPLWTVGEDGKSHPPAPEVLQREKRSRLEYRAKAAYSAKLKRDAMATKAEAEERLQREKLAKTFDDLMWDQFKSELDDHSPPILRRVPMLLNTVAESLVEALPRRIRSKIGQEIRDVLDWDVLRSRLTARVRSDPSSEEFASGTPFESVTPSVSSPASPAGSPTTANNSSSAFQNNLSHRFEAITNLVIYVINRVGQLGAPAREEELHNKAKDLVARLKHKLAIMSGSSPSSAATATLSSNNSNDTIGSLIVEMMQFMLESIRQLRVEIATYSLQMVSSELIANATAYEKEFVSECLPPPKTWETTKAFLSKGIEDALNIPMIPTVVATTATAASAAATPLHQQTLKPIAVSLPASILYVTDEDKKIFAGVVGGIVDLLRSSGRDSGTRWALYPSEALYFARPLVFEAANTVQMATLRLMLSGTVSMVLAPHRVNAQAVQEFIASLDAKVIRWLGGGGENDKNKGAPLEDAEERYEDDDERPVNSIEEIKSAVNEQVSIFLGSKPLIGNGPTAKPSPQPILPSESDVAVLNGVIGKMTDTSSPQYTLFETRVLRAVAAVAIGNVGMSSSGLSSSQTNGANNYTANTPSQGATATASAGWPIVGVAAAVAAGEAALRGCGALVGPAIKEVAGLVSSIIMQNWEVHRANYAAIFQALEVEGVSAAEELDE